MKAVIIAAGCGSRLKEYHQGIPKSLLVINGIRIIDDIISKIIKTGISEIVVITGYKQNLLQDYLKVYNTAKIAIDFVYNSRWEEANGISVLCAKEVIQPDDEFLILMSDHIFQQRILKDIVTFKLLSYETLLAVDQKIESIPDLDDGMKLQCGKFENNLCKITEFGKQLTEYDAIDTGIFRMRYLFFNYLEQSISDGKASLSDACNLMCKSGKMLGMDIQENYWLDIDTPEMLEHKELLRKIIGQ